MTKTILAIILVSILSVSGVSAQREIRPSDYVITLQQAFDYASNVISPILVRHANDPKEIPGLRNRLVKIGLLTQENRIDYRAEPAFYPGNKTVLAHWEPPDDLDPKHREVFMVFIPAVQDTQRMKSSKEFDDYIAVAFAHEVIHYEQLAEFPQKPLIDKPYGPAQMREEAYAWGKTVLEILRPLIRQGRIKDKQFLIFSEQLSRFKDDYKDPGWIRGFAKYMQ